jgi:hypothetical protein
VAWEGVVLGAWTSPSSPSILAEMRERERELFGRSKAHVYLLKLEIYSMIVMTLRVYEYTPHDT